MYTVTVENPCRCFFRNGLPESQSFSSKEAAQKEAESLLAYMQKNFCKKHTFHLVSGLNGYTVSIRDA